MPAHARDAQVHAQCVRIRTRTHACICWCFRLLCEPGSLRLQLLCQEKALLWVRPPLVHSFCACGTRACTHRNEHSRGTHHLRQPDSKVCVQPRAKRMYVNMLSHRGSTQPKSASTSLYAHTRKPASRTFSSLYAYRRICKRSGVRTCSCAHAQTCICTHMGMQCNACLHLHTCARMHVHAHSHMRTHRYKDAHCQKEMALLKQLHDRKHKIETC